MPRLDRSYRLHCLTFLSQLFSPNLLYPLLQLLFDNLSILIEPLKTCTYQLSALTFQRHLFVPLSLCCWSLSQLQQVLIVHFLDTATAWVYRICIPLVLVFKLSQLALEHDGLLVQDGRFATFSMLMCDFLKDLADCMRIKPLPYEHVINVTELCLVVSLIEQLIQLVSLFKLINSDVRALHHFLQSNDLALGLPQ